MRDIVKVHYPDIEENILKAVLVKFYELRDYNQLKKKPSTSELIDWILVLMKSGIKEEDLKQKGFPFLGALVKKEQDMEYLTKFKGIS
jgi:MoxR-like ATPase